MSARRRGVVRGLASRRRSHLRQKPHLLLPWRGFAVASSDAAGRVSQAVVFFLLASEISPRRFGYAAVAFLAAQVTHSVSYAGIGAAVQALGPDRIRDRTAVSFAFLSGTAAGAALVLLAPLICGALHTAPAPGLVRLVALSLPFGQVGDVQTALLERSGLFVRPAVAGYVAAAVALAVGVALVQSGAGPIALVVQWLLLQSVRVLVLSASRIGRVRPGWSTPAARELWHVGRHLLAWGFLGNVYLNLDNATVGAVSGPAALGGYGFVYNLANVPYYLVSSAASRVMLPLYAERLRRKESLGGQHEITIAATALIAGLPLGYLAIAGPAALVVVFGHKWDYVAVTLQILSFCAWCRTLNMAISPALIASGHERYLARAQWLLTGLMVLLVVPLTFAFGTIGTAVAVTVPQLLVLLGMLGFSARITGAHSSRLASLVTVGAGVGALGGLAAWAFLHVAGEDAGGLLASLVVATLIAGLAARVMSRRFGPLSQLTDTGELGSIDQSWAELAAPRHAPDIGEWT